MVSARGAARGQKTINRLTALKKSLGKATTSALPLSILMIMIMCVCVCIYICTYTIYICIHTYSITLCDITLCF